MHRLRPVVPRRGQEAVLVWVGVRIRVRVRVEVGVRVRVRVRVRIRARVRVRVRLARSSPFLICALSSGSILSNQPFSYALSSPKGSTWSG